MVAFALGTVITALQLKKKTVSHRGSKLTYLLQGTIGGSGKSTILANLSPSPYASVDTINTLKFASAICRAELKGSRKATRESELASHGLAPTADGKCIGVQMLLYPLLPPPDLLPVASSRAAHGGQGGLVTPPCDHGPPPACSLAAPEEINSYS